MCPLVKSRHSACHFAGEYLFGHKYLSTNEISDTGMSSLLFNIHIFYDTCCTVYNYTHSNQNIDIRKYLGGS